LDDLRKWQHEQNPLDFSPTMEEFLGKSTNKQLVPVLADSTNTF
jgi:hypothetical protein